MERNYYSMPLELDRIINMKDSHVISLYDSVTNMLRLLTVSNFDECKHDYKFGCAIWEEDFDTMTKIHLFKEKVKLSIENAISNYEKRISNVVVDVGIKQSQSFLTKKRVKNRISIIVKGKLIQTNEDYIWAEDFFIGPLSYY